MGYITGVWEKKEEKPQIMRMEIVLSEEKAKLHGIDVNKGYKAIDDYFENRGVPKLGQGIYECIEDDNSFSTFSVAIAQLPETKWFPFLFFRRNKTGNTRAIAPKESIYEKGWDEYEQIQFIRCTLN